MARNHDIATKHLVEAHLPDWIRFLGLRFSGKARMVDSDLSISTAADKLAWVGGPSPYLLHLELQSGPDSTLPERGLAYNVLGHRRYHLPVLTVVVLLSPRAQHPAVNGVYGYEVEGGSVWQRYRMIRVWELDPGPLLAGGLGTLPLALLAAIKTTDAPRIVTRIRQRLSRDATPRQARELWTAARLLMGLRYPVPLIDQLLRGVHMLEESVTYQEILNKGIEQGIEQGLKEGRLLAARRSLEEVGSARFRKPTARMRAKINRIDDEDELALLLKRALTASKWEDVLS